MVYPGLLYQEYPTHCHSPRGGLAEKASPTNPHIPSPIPPQDLTGQPPTTLEKEAQTESSKLKQSTIIQ